VSCGCAYDDCNGECTPHCTNSPSKGECPALGDPGANFGNGFYNDHHFHYGYWVYGAAVAARYNSSWEQKWREQLLTLIRDYGNPSAEDPFFPVVRHMDWFLGFSWAGGIVPPVADGRNQESTSEAINAYYALYTFGHSVQGAPFAKGLKDLGRLLVAMESHGADTYWHVRPKSDIYPDFPHSCVGITWTHRVLFQTWFGPLPYMVCGIQQLPYTPVSEHFLDKTWVASQFPTSAASCDADPNCAKQGWSWLMCLEQAILSVSKATECLSKLPKDAFDVSNAGANGNSLTNSLHWIATRPQSRRLGSRLVR